MRLPSGWFSAPVIDEIWRVAVQPSASAWGLNRQMRILRGLSSRVLPCGCLAGLYETYDSEIVGILDARGLSCADSSHEPGQTLPLDANDDTPRLSAQSSDRNQGKRI